MATAPATQPSAQNISWQITTAIRSMGLTPIPRNYELFYEAYIGSNPALSHALTQLGNRATQEDVDEIGRKFFNRNPADTLDDTRSQLTSEIGKLMQTLQLEQTALAKYDRVLKETGKRMEMPLLGSEFVRSTGEALASATGSTLEAGKLIAKSVQNASTEMESIRRELEEYKRLASTDPLTRLYNRREFDKAIREQFAPKADHALLIGDIDHFKSINDRFGHPIGDKILATVAGVFRTVVPKDAFMARTGGEEFAIIMNRAGHDLALSTADQLREAIFETPLKNSRTGINYGPVSMSFGFCIVADSEDPDDWYRKADAALYSAKKTGRNKSVRYSGDIDKAAMMMAG